MRIKLKYYSELKFADMGKKLTLSHWKQIEEIYQTFGFSQAINFISGQVQTAML